MAREKFECANPKCKTKKPEELSQLNPGLAFLEPYCLKNKRTCEVDAKKLAKLKIEVAKLRCDECFATFLKRNKLHTFYHLIETKKPENSNDPKQAIDDKAIETHCEPQSERAEESTEASNGIEETTSNGEDKDSVCESKV